jgi:hypothetical protein
MTNSPYKPYPKDSPEFQKWVQGRQGSGNYGNYGQNSYQNNQGNRHFQQTSGSSNRNFYQNASFPNQGDRPQFNQPRPPYIAPAVTKFMKEQEKMNQVMLEQTQAISAQLAKLNVIEPGKENANNASVSADRGKLPSKPETNPIITRVPPEN